MSEKKITPFSMDSNPGNSNERRIVDGNGNLLGYIYYFESANEYEVRDEKGIMIGYAKANTDRVPGFTYMIGQGIVSNNCAPEMLIGMKKIKEAEEKIKEEQRIRELENFKRESNEPRKLIWGQNPELEEEKEKIEELKRQHEIEEFNRKREIEKMELKLSELNAQKEQENQEKKLFEVIGELIMMIKLIYLIIKGLIKLIMFLSRPIVNMIKRRKDRIIYF